MFFVTKISWGPDITIAKDFFINVAVIFLTSPFISRKYCITTVLVYKCDKVFINTMML